MESVAFVELQVAIEAEYDIEVDPIRVIELDRFGDVVAYIDSLVEAAR
jgi:acyl carrier protein